MWILVVFIVLVHVGMVLKVWVFSILAWGAGMMEMAVVVGIGCCLLFKMVLKCVVGNGVACCSMVVVLE